MFGLLDFDCFACVVWFCLWCGLIFNWFVGDSDCLYLVGGAVLWCLPELSLWCVINSVVH